MTTYLYPCMPKLISLSALEMIDNDPCWIAEVKRNGWRCLAIKDEKGEVKLWSRHKREIELDMEELKELLKERLPDDTIIDGELLRVNNEPGYDRDRPARDMKDVGAYYVFDVLKVAGKMVTGRTWTERNGMLDEVTGYSDHAWTVAEEKMLMLAVPTIENKVRMFTDCQDQEGIVVKNIHGKYPVSYTRCHDNHGWYKIKHRR